MVKYDDAALDATFGALADPTRRAILGRLAAGEATVTALAEPFDMSLPAISKHLRVLERAGLLAREVDGRIHRLGLVPDRLRTAGEWIAEYRRFWEGRLDALARYLDTDDRKETDAWSRSSSSERSRRHAPASSAHGRSPRSSRSGGGRTATRRRRRR